MTRHAATSPAAGSLRTTKAAVVVLAGGSGARLGAEVNKVYLPLAGRPVLSWSFAWAARLPDVQRFVLVIRPQDRALAERMLAEAWPGLGVELVTGGPTRHASEQAALDHLAAPIHDGTVGLVAIHDGARPLAGTRLFRAVLDAAAATGGAVPGVPATGLLPVPTPDGGTQAVAEQLVRVQTPQAFRAGPLLEAYRAAREGGYVGTDTAACLEAYSGSGLTIQVVPGHRYNIKVTYAGDLPLAERLLGAHADALARSLIG